MFLSILNIQSSEIQNVLQTFDPERNLVGLDLSSERPPLQTRRVICLLLARYLAVKADFLSETQARELEIQRYPSGEPYLTHPDYPDNSLPAISISHSGPWMACLLSGSNKPACIDIEDTTIFRLYQKISEHVFSESENQFVLKSGKMGFYKLWTAKESIAKYPKKGLTQTLKMDFGFQLDKPLEASRDVSVYHINTGGEAYTLYQKITDHHLFWCIALKGIDETISPKLFFL